MELVRTYNYLINYLLMSKSLFVVLIALFVMSATAHSVDEMMKSFRNDKCISNEIDSVKPMIEEKIAALKMVIQKLFRTRRMLLLKPNSFHLSETLKLKLTHAEAQTRSNPN